MTKVTEKPERSRDPQGRNEAVVMNFDGKKLAEIYSNVQPIEDDRFASYRVVNEYGSDAGNIAVLGGSEVRIFVDNFPGQKKYYSCNYPVKTIEQFEMDVARTGLKLVRRDS
jgi:hypothetical protein